VRILLDHCVPKPFKKELPEHEVSTAREMGWEALKNGELINQAQANGFDIIITVDQNVRFQQNLGGRKIAVCLLIARGITTDKSRSLVPAIAELLTAIKPGKLYQVKASDLNEQP